jgi:hypothetical protein
MWSMRSFRLPLFLALACASLSAFGQNPWMGFGGDYSHWSQSKVRSRAIVSIVWSKPVDLNPPYNNDSLLIHYGSPCITPDNKVIIPVKTGLDDGFKITAVDGATGTTLWNSKTTYSLPPHDWVPSFNPTLLPPVEGSTEYRVAWPESGGRIAIRSNLGSATGAKKIYTFYGAAAYRKDAANYDATVKVCTPLTAGPDGSIYFGYVVLGDNLKNLKSGLAKIAPNGTATHVNADDIAGDLALTYIKTNSAPALNRKGNRLYTVCANGNFGRGRIVSINPETMTVISRADLLDPSNGNYACVDFSGTASPLVGPDGDVYVGVLENPFPSNHYRGWLLHFSGDLHKTKTPGAFGWDNTASIVPSSIVPFYTGTSKYLLFTKYNNYAVSDTDGGDNRIALVDPNDARVEQQSGVSVMKKISTMLGPTHDGRFSGDQRMEWCVNFGVVDIKGKCILANSEDGMVYRWDLVTNQLSESIRITPGLGQAYTCTLIGPDGKVYAINNAHLFAIGSHPRS